ncbi:hypothetical protein COV15_01450 [Candidatus Woesearchaeota archaeon CG10_big_fil_rev_8_21_14_0_10_34_12]|nr:MAG: hypothetical protein COV15_01450 [Candidatus Woesearchaeota archaeon CG10_big_fil_rev_8_21_14_0_10_34_12]
MANYDILGNIAIMKFPEKTKKSEKLKKAKQLMKTYKSLTTVLEKKEKVKGRLRTIKTRFLLGEKTKEARYNENNCIFRLNVESCYFSPRLSGERAEVARKIKRGSRVLVMFAGVAPFAIVAGKQRKAKEIIAIELGKECCRYAEENVKLNKLQNVKIIQGNVKKKVTKKLGKFDVVLMPRPQLKDTFLKQAFAVSKKGTVIYYYGFQTAEEIRLEKTQKQILEEAKKAKKKIEILEQKLCGELAPYKSRIRVDLRVL